MKKTKILSIFASLLVMMSAVVLYSCNKNNTTIPPKVVTSTTKQNNKTQLVSSNFEDIGNMHNAYMTHFARNFVIPNTLPNNLSERVNLVNDFLKNYTNLNENLSLTEKQDINNGLDNYKQLLVKTNFLEKNKYDSLQILISNAYSLDKIDVWERDKMTNLCLMLKKGSEGKLSLADYTDFINSSVIEYHQRGYISNSNYGHLSRCVLSIAKASLNWWNENREELPENGVPTDLILYGGLAGDAMGALWGAACAIHQGANWYGVAGGALTAGVGGSVGWVTKTCLIVGLIVG